MRNTISRTILLVLIALPIITCAFPVPQLPYSPKNYICYRAIDSIVVDGKLSEKSWNEAEWTDYFVDIEGSLKPIPKYKTRVKMVWDLSGFYFAAELEEPHIWATYNKRDAVIFHENDFEIFIDPDGDTHQYYEFEMNALNTVWDLLLVTPYRDGGPAVNGWDIAGLKSAVHLNGTLNQPENIDSSWTLEVFFPWTAMSECAHRTTPPNDGDLWRVNFSRVEWNLEISDGKYVKKTNPSTGKPLSEENWVWTPQGLIAMHYPERWGIVQFTSAFVGNQTVKYQPDPDEKIRALLYEVYYREQHRKENGLPFTTSVRELNLVSTEFEKVIIEVLSDHFVATLQSVTTGRKWKIDSSGRIQSFPASSR